jgi:hypothetical protein
MVDLGWLGHPQVGLSLIDRSNNIHTWLKFLEISNTDLKLFNIVFDVRIVLSEICSYPARIAIRKDADMIFNDVTSKFHYSIFNSIFWRKQKTFFNIYWCPMLLNTLCNKL